MGFAARATGESSICLSSAVKLAGDSEASGKNSIVVGVYGAKATGEGSIAIGWGAEATADRAVAIGAGAKSSTKRRIALGDNSSSVEVAGTVVHTSDRRLKYVGKEFTSGLDKIRQIKPFNYTFKKDETKTPRVGVIAQDLMKIFPNAVTKGADGFFSIRMEDMFYAVINAVKELDSRVSRLEKENKELKARLEKLEAKLK